jgi:diguanylate cyclase (GGDEF)-like protein
VHPDDADAAQRLLSGLAPGQSAGADHRLRRRDGSWLDAETLATNLLGDETVDAIILNTRDVSQRKELERRLAHQATHDALTGLPGRMLFEELIGHSLRRSRRSGLHVAVLFVDLDDFKTINDTLGHAAGDTAPREVARRLDAAVRDCDSVARLSGDEFAVLLDGVHGLDDAVEVAERCLEALASPLAIGDRELDISASIGITLGDGRSSAEPLIQRADAAMYRAKREGKRRHAIAEPASPTLS